MLPSKLYNGELYSSGIYECKKFYEMTNSTVQLVTPSQYFPHSFLEFWFVPIADKMSWWDIHKVETIVAVYWTEIGVQKRTRFVHWVVISSCYWKEKYDIKSINYAIHYKIKMQRHIVSTGCSWFLWMNTFWYS